MVLSAKRSSPEDAASTDETTSCSASVAFCPVGTAYVTTSFSLQSIDVSPPSSPLVVDAHAWRVLLASTVPPATVQKSQPTMMNSNSQNDGDSNAATAKRPMPLTSNSRLFGSCTPARARKCTKKKKIPTARQGQTNFQPVFVFLLCVCIACERAPAATAKPPTNQSSQPNTNTLPVATGSYRYR